MILIKFLFFFFFIFLVLIGLMGFSLVRGAKRMFGGGNKQQQQAGEQRRSYTYTNTGSRQGGQTSGNTQSSYAEEVNGEPRYRRRRKVYGHDEGEYVDYEEVKD